MKRVLRPLGLASAMVLAMSTLQFTLQHLEALLVETFSENPSGLVLSISVPENQIRAYPSASASTAPTPEARLERSNT
jgi:hypothetical protein